MPLIGFGQKTDIESLRKEIFKELIETYPDLTEMTKYHLSKMEDDVLVKIINVTKDYHLVIGDEIKLRNMIFDLLEGSKSFLIDGSQNNSNDIKWNNYCHCVCDFVLKSGVNSIKAWYAHPDILQLAQDSGNECNHHL
jgi:hypothetical protein